MNMPKGMDKVRKLIKLVIDGLRKKAIRPKKMKDFRLTFRQVGCIMR